MVNMMATVKKEFPGLYTRKGAIRKREPKKYICDCGDSFSKLKTTFRSRAIAFGSPICPSCGQKGKENVEYNIYKRLITGQMEQEDEILNIVKKRGKITKEALEGLINAGDNPDALGTLVYFGYLLVDREKRDNEGIVEYQINPKKKLDNRYELIR